MPKRILRLNKRHIVVNDYDPDILKFLVQILSTAGYNARPDSDGELALQSVQAKVPEMVLMDYIMPDLNAIEVCQQFQEKTNHQKYPYYRRLILNFLNIEPCLDFITNK